MATFACVPVWVAQLLLLFVWYIWSFEWSCAVAARSLQLRSALKNELFFLYVYRNVCCCCTLKRFVAFFSRARGYILTDRLMLLRRIVRRRSVENYYFKRYTKSVYMHSDGCIADSWKTDCNRLYAMWKEREQTACACV